MSATIFRLVRVIAPVKWNIEIERSSDDGKYRVRYVEVLERPGDTPPDKWEIAVRNSEMVLKKLGCDYSIRSKGDSKGDVVEVEIHSEGDLSEIATAIVGEFIAFSSVADLKLRDLLALPLLLKAFRKIKLNYGVQNT